MVLGLSIFPDRAGRAGHVARGRAADDPAGVRLEHLGARVPARQDPGRDDDRARAVRCCRSGSCSRSFGLRCRRRSHAAARRERAVRVLRGELRLASSARAIPNQAAAAGAVAARRLPRCRSCSSGLIFPIENIPGRAALDLEPRCRPATTSSSSATPSCRAAAGPPCGGRSLAIGAIGAVFYALAWRAMRRMQVKA